MRPKVVNPCYPQCFARIVCAVRHFLPSKTVLFSFFCAFMFEILLHDRQYNQFRCLISVMAFKNYQLRLYLVGYLRNMFYFSREICKTRPGL